MLKQNSALLFFLLVASASPLFSQDSKTQILLLGSDHLAQVYRENNSHTDVLAPGNQLSVSAFNEQIAQFKPDLVMIEELPEAQQRIDSLYESYRSDQLDLHHLPGGRSEIYTIAFPIAKKSGLSRIHCINAPGGTSQSILDNGNRIELYKEYGATLRKTVIAKYEALGKGELSFKDYLTFLNQPTAYEQVYRLRYIIPARVTHGYFHNPDKSIDTTRIDKAHIGAELISHFKNRDYKIYSNVVTSQLDTGAKRILLIIGVAHIGSLKNIFNDDPYFRVIDANEYLAPQADREKEENR